MNAAQLQSSGIGVGLYSLAEAARIVHARPRRIAKWLAEDTGVVPSAFEAAEHTINFQQLMELHFIKMFRDHGVSLPIIRKAAAEAAKKFHTPYPFCVHRFDTDGHRIFATLSSEGRRRKAVEELPHGQLVFSQICKPFFKKLDYRKSAEILRYWPMNKAGRIAIDPARKFGKPIDFETGVPTQAIYDAAQAGGGQEQSVVARWLGIPIAAVRAAVAIHPQYTSLKR